MVTEEVLLAFKALSLATQIFTTLMEKSGATLEEVKAAVDEEERKTFEKVDARIAELKGQLGQQ